MHAEDERGSVLDYMVAASAIITRIRSLKVLSIERRVSDHCPVCFSWEGRPSGLDGSTSDAALNPPRIEIPRVWGWRFLGTFTGEKCENATVNLSEHPGFAQFLPTL